MTMRGRDRRLLAVAGFGALLLAFSPVGSALTQKPLGFATVAHGTAQASDLVRQHVDSAAYTHRTFLDAANMVNAFGMGDAVRAAVDRIDLRTHVVVMIFARRSLEPTRVTLRPLPFRYAHTELCVDVRSRGATLPIDFAFTVVSVKKPKGLDRLLDVHEGIPVVVRERGKLITPKPPGVTRPARCP